MLLSTINFKQHIMQTYTLLCQKCKVTNAQHGNLDIEAKFDHFFEMYV